MRPVNSGRWMLALFVVASLVVPGVVAARAQAVSSTAPLTAPSPELVGVELGLAAEQLVETAPSVGMCFNRTCTSHAQCRTWCDEPSAYCAPVDFPPHYKRCHLP
jgi:hypothetical protein